MNVHRASIAACIFALLFTSSLAAQYSERVDVSIASIDVVVRDKAGNLVRGLTKDDFEVYEDGKLQTITNFSAIDVSVPVAEPSGDRVTDESALVKAVRAPRLLVLFFDIREIDPSSRKEFFETVRAFVDSTVGEGDFASILVWSNRIRVVLPPTSDRARLDAVFGAFANQKFGTLSAALARAEEQLGQGDSDAFAREAGMLPTSDQGADASFEEFVRTEKLCLTLKRKAREMRNLLTHLTKIEMKKVLLFASDETQLRPNRTCDVSGVFAALADTANAYGITIHGLHPPGARTKIIAPDKDPTLLPRDGDRTAMSKEYARAFNESAGLSVLAESTGGVFGIGRQSAPQLKRAAEELDIYYSIGYSLSPGNEDRARKVRVVTRNGNYRIRTRETVVRMSEGARLRDHVATNLYFPEQTDPQSPAFTARVVGIERDDRLRRVAVKLSIRSSDLFLVPDANGEKMKGSFSVLVAAGRELGDASDVTELRQDFEAGSEGVEATEIGYSFETRVRPDTRRLSIAVRDNNTGEVATTIVPLKGEE